MPNLWLLAMFFACGILFFWGVFLQRKWINAVSIVYFLFCVLLYVNHQYSVDRDVGSQKQTETTKKQLS